MAILLYPSLNIYGLQLGFFASLFGVLKPCSFRISRRTLENVLMKLNCYVEKSIFKCVFIAYVFEAMMYAKD
jgi:hypothetical protein